MATRKLPRPFNLHWRSGQIVEEATADGEYHTPAIQLLRYDEGEAAGTLSIRFAYFNRTGAFQRSPLIVDEAMIDGLRDAVARAPGLQRLLRRLADCDQR